ncbi:MAG: threonylcarbamoyl-AMP synthase [Patescibacteria group bacterium]|nr:threonylcarbamoyl-AMP synthase [Patescibacteria group bacterium]
MKEAKMSKQGSVGVIPTDTLYGIVASAFSEEAVERVYTLKKRTPAKPCIILIPSSAYLVQFGVVLTAERQNLLSRYWPGPVSVVLPCGDDVPEYLHRGTHTLSFRVPDNAALTQFLRESGPLIAPSANPEGMPPAKTIEEAKKYFGDQVDFYLDGGTCTGMPSTVIALDENNTPTIIREGRPIKL